MRLISLSIERYKNLHNLTWTLDPTYPVALIVGKNASGKTNFLQAIITIFQELQLFGGSNRNYPSINFAFEMSYHHQAGHVTISNQLEGHSPLEIRLNDLRVPIHELKTLRNSPYRGGKDILPRNIFVYYAGTSTRLKDLIRTSNNAFRRVLSANTSQSELYYDATQPLFYYEPIHYKFVFLLLLVTNLEDIKRDYLEKDFNITGLSKVNFTIERPHRRKSESEETLWGAPPKLAAFLEFIRKNGHKTESPPKARKETYNFPAHLFADSIRQFGLEIDLFQTMSSLHLTGYLKDLKIYFHKRDLRNTIEFDDLSEGEKQRLAVRGLMEIFRGEETLYLLDEPDTFAHPRWQWDFIPDIEEAIGNNTSSQTIFVTHSPLVLSTAKANAFWMEAGKISPLRETFGRDANMSLVKMHAQGESEDVKKDFEVYFDLIQEGAGESDQALSERRKLVTKYGSNHPELSRADVWIAFYK